MSKKAFQNGLGCYQKGDYQEALRYFNKAVEAGGQSTYLVLDSRAAVYAKLGRRKEALQDAKKTIDVAPNRWQGYARAARVFLQSNKPESALTMVKLALERLEDNDTSRRASLLDLEEEVRYAQESLEKHRQRFMDHIAKLPIELFGDICRILVEESQTALIPLLHVCKYWRSVIDNTPYLWNALVLTQRRPKQKAKMWIERSSGRLRELSVTHGHSFPHNWPDDWLQGLHWEHLRILRSRRWQVMTYLRSIDRLHVLDNLDQIVLDERDIEDTITQHLFPNSQSEDLPLQHLAMFNVSIPVETVAKCVKGLKSLELRNCINIAFDIQWAHLLAANPLLESLSVEKLTPLLREDFEIRLDHLTSLEVVKGAPHNIYTAKIPKLRSLKLRSPNITANIFIKHLVDTNVVHLTELILQYCSFSDMTPVIAFLKLSTNLQMLEISNTSAGVVSIIEALAAHYSPPSQHPLLRDPLPTVPLICPKLTHVNFSSCPEVQTGPLVRMIKSRLPANSQEVPVTQTDEMVRIESLVIDGCPNVDATWLPKIRDAVSHVSCTYMTKKTKFRTSG